VEARAPGAAGSARRSRPLARTAGTRSRHGGDNRVCPQTQGKIERWHQTLKNPSCWRITIYPAISKPRSRRSSNITTITLPREPEQRNARRRLLRQGTSHHQTARKDQTTDYRISALATPQNRRIILTNRMSPNTRLF
jgi:hypothetical protein